MNDTATPVRPIEYPKHIDKAFIMEWLQTDKWPSWDCIYLLLDRKPSPSNHHDNTVRLYRSVIDTLLNNTEENFEKNAQYYNPMTVCFTGFQCINNFSSLIFGAYHELNGTSLDYIDGAPIYNFFYKWGIRDRWTLREAICAINMIDPVSIDYVKGYYRGVSNPPTPNPLFPCNERLYRGHVELAKSCRGISLKISDNTEHGYVKPIEFLDFCDKKRILYKPLLRQIVEEQAGIVSTPNTTVVETTNNIYNRGRPKKFNTEAWGVEVFRYLSEHGKLPESKTEMINHIKAFQEKLTQHTPGNTTVSDFLTPYYDIMNNHEK